MGIDIIYPLRERVKTSRALIGRSALRMPYQGHRVAEIYDVAHAELAGNIEAFVTGKPIRFFTADINRSSLTE